jgi:polar amino acid transport system substrate-binding protein
MTVSRLALAVLAMLVASLPASRPASADQLSDIKSRGKLVCGTLGTSEPFSFQDPSTREIVGYDVDMCRHVAEALNVALEIKAISVEARIPELVLGRVDILAANLGYTKERAAQIAYSDTYFVSAQKILVRADSGLTKLGELTEKKISAVKGSSSEQGVHRFIPSATVLTYQDGSTAFLAVDQGKVAGFCASELVLVKLKAKAQSAIDIISEPLFVEEWGLGMRWEEGAFRDSVNATLAAMEHSGEAARLFEHWFGEATLYRMKREFTIAPIKG